MKTHQKLIIGATLLSAFLVGSSVHAETSQDMYRLYNPNSGEHFYTANVNEKNNLIHSGWKDEGIGWTAPLNGKPVYRLYNPNAGDHHYTLSSIERNNLARIGWKDEGVGWYSDINQSVPLYRLYNPYAKTATHHYTSNVTESKMLTLIGWKDEGIGWYGVNKKNNDNNNHNNSGNTNTSGNTNNDGSGNNSNNQSGNNGNNTNNNGNDNNSNKPIDNDRIVDKSNQLNKKKIAKLYFDLVNQERERVGVRKLIWDDKLAEAAQIRAKELTVKFKHERLDGSSPLTVMSEVGITNMKMSGEAASQARPPFTNEQEVANILFQRQKASAPHYAIMIKPNHIYNGIGIERGDYLFYMCDIFAI